MEEKEVNNLETPINEEITDGQGEEADKIEEIEQITEDSEESKKEKTQEKGIPDDPKLLRAKMTQATQKASEIEKQFMQYKERVDKLLSHPKFREIYEEIEKENVGQVATQPQQDEIEFNDQQREIYNTLKPYLQRFLYEAGVVPKLSEIEQFTKASQIKALMSEAEAAYAKFISDHPEAKNPEVGNAIAEIINSRLDAGIKISLDDAWAIYKFQTAEKEAKNKLTQEMDLKKQASLPKPTSSEVIVPTPKNLTKKQAVELALKQLKL